MTSVLVNYVDGQVSLIKVMSFGVLKILHSGQCNWRSTHSLLSFEINHCSLFKNVMSAFLTSECVRGQRRGCWWQRVVLEMVSRVQSQRHLAMDFPMKNPFAGCQKHWAAWCQLQEKCWNLRARAFIFIFIFILASSSAILGWGGPTSCLSSLSAVENL